MFKKVLLVAAGAAAGVAGALFLKDRVTLACEDDCCCDCDFSPATAAKVEESASVKTSSLSGEDMEKVKAVAGKLAADCVDPTEFVLLGVKYGCLNPANQKFGLIMHSIGDRKVYCVDGVFVLMSEQYQAGTVEFEILAPGSDIQAEQEKPGSCRVAMRMVCSRPEMQSEKN